MNTLDEERVLLEEKLIKEGVCKNAWACQHKWLPYEYVPFNTQYLEMIMDGNQIYRGGQGQRLSTMICSECGEVKKVEAK